MLRRSAAAELAPEIASPTALFFWPGPTTVRRAESTVVPAEQLLGRASVNALGRRLEVGPARLVLPTASLRDPSASDMNFLVRLLRLLFGTGTRGRPRTRRDRSRTPRPRRRVGRRVRRRPPPPRCPSPRPTRISPPMHRRRPTRRPRSRPGPRGRSASRPARTCRSPGRRSRPPPRGRTCSATPGSAGAT